MTLREEVDALFDQARQNIQARVSPPGITPREGENPTAITINEVNVAIVESLHLLADRIDAIMSKQEGT